MTKSFECVQTDNKKSVLGEKSSSLVMAPAILANSKLENKNSKLSSKQNMKKMDPGSIDTGEKRVPIDFTVLKTQLSSENLFISSLLTNIPTQSISSVQDRDGNTTCLDVHLTKEIKAEGRADDHEELKQRLEAKLSQFKGIDKIK